MLLLSTLAALLAAVSSQPVEVFNIDPMAHRDQLVLSPGFVFKNVPFTNTSFYPPFDKKPHTGIEGPNCMYRDPYLTSPPPPNLDDCGKLMAEIGKLHANMDIPASSCLDFSYRSCRIYQCASGCSSDNFSVNTDNWNERLKLIQTECVNNGMVGYTWADGMPRWVDVIEHVASPVPITMFQLCNL